MRCLRAYVYVVSMVGTVWMSECDSGERGVYRQREEEGGVCGIRVTSAIQRSPQPVNGNLMSRLTSPLLSLPTIPLLFILSPLLDLPSILPSLPCVFGGNSTRETAQCSELSGGRQTQFLSAWQTIITVTVCQLERAKPPLFGLVAKGRMGRS